MFQYSSTFFIEGNIWKYWQARDLKLQLLTSHSQSYSKQYYIRCDIGWEIYLISINIKSELIMAADSKEYIVPLHKCPYCDTSRWPFMKIINYHNNCIWLSIHPLYRAVRPASSLAGGGRCCQKELSQTTPTSL